MEEIKETKSSSAKKEHPQFKAGDTVRVYVQIKEEDKVRLQAFEGIVIRKRGKGLKVTFTVRKISYGEGVERTFLLHSPLIERLEIVKTGRTRRARLYYLRKKIGKKSKVAEKLEQA